MIRALMTLPLTSRGDWKGMLKKAADNGANCIRFFLKYLDDDLKEPNFMAPFEEIGEWNPGEIAGDAARNHIVPMYDLTKRNPAFIDFIEDLAAEMFHLGLAPWIAFDDRCSETEGDWRQFNDPYYSNCQLHPWWNANPPSTERAFAGGNQALELNIYHEILEQEVYNIFLAAGHTTIYAEPKNEYGYDEGPAYTIDDMLNWFGLRAQNLSRLGYKVIGSIRPPITAQGIADMVDLYDQHAIITTADATAKMIENGLPYGKVIWNTDGAWNGTGPGMSCFGIHDASPTQMDALGKEAVAKLAAGVCFLPQVQIDDPDGPWNMDKIDYNPLQAMSLAMGWTPPVPPPPDKVRVTLCTLTYAVANPYCPTTISARSS